MFTLLFGNYTFPNQTFEVEGFPIDANVDEDSIPRKHGSVIRASYLKSRKFRINGIIHNSTTEASHTQLINMQQSLFLSESNFQYRSDRYIKCFTKNIKPDGKKGTDKAMLDISIELVAQNPFFYSAGASYSDVQTPVKGTTLLFNLYNGGNVFSEPIFKICATGGTINDDIQLKNITNNNQLFKFRGVITGGLTLELNTEDFTVLNSGVDGLSNFEGDFLTLLAGTNLFEFVGATCRLTSDWRYRWY